ncbi:Alpha/Beta hydrolase protein [Catenaria anguillulae PL171]|uniref:Alpha/Beta hydrolase protein n=1 Tax=Catenaria anguillulae PL171 TaxID=765915 RepID=A0A1Y2HYP2_9FUNG|nr:Alpha/Beta hydrolase protein [Catenaria anguillulae PL171]
MDSLSQTASDSSLAETAAASPADLQPALDPPFTHHELPTAATANGKPSFLSRALSCVSSWYWPANAHQAHAAEQALLSLIPPSPLYRTRSGFIDVAADSGPNANHQHALINTLIIEPTTPPANPQPPIVFLHGYGAGLALWYRTLPEIAAQLIPHGSTLYAIDWLGMARSGRVPFPIGSSLPPTSPETSTASHDPKRPHGVAEAEDYFLSSLDRWRARITAAASGSPDADGKVILVGHSLGGYLAANYALRHPDKVAQLILVSPVGVPARPAENPSVARPLPAHWAAIRSAAHKLWAGGYTPFSVMRGVGPLGPSLMGWYTSRRFAATITDEKEQGLVRDYLFHANNAGMAAGEYALGALLDFGAWARDPLAPRLKGLWSGLEKVKTRFVYGTVDWMNWEHAGRVLVGEKVGQDAASVHLVEGAGHQVFLDNPSGFADVVVDCVKNAREPTVSRVEVEQMVQVLAASSTGSEESVRRNVR